MSMNRNSRHRIRTVKSKTENQSFSKCRNAAKHSHNHTELCEPLKRTIDTTIVTRVNSHQTPANSTIPQ